MIEKIDSKGFISMFFYGTLGSMLASILVGMVSITCLIIGYSFIKKYNKKGSKLLKDLQRNQYIGITFCIIGMTPWIRYLIAGFGLEMGESIFNELFK